jgi:hypothetical protein
MRMTGGTNVPAELVDSIMQKWEEGTAVQCFYASVPIKSLHSPLVMFKKEKSTEITFQSQNMLLIFLLYNLS